MNPDLPIIYSPRLPGGRVTLGGRVLALLIGASCLAVLIFASHLKPDHSGIGTHTELGLQSCAFLDRTGIPCPSCGMTTSFAFFAHAHPIVSFYVQPMGFILALISAAAVWVGFYIAITGRAVHRLMREQTMIHSIIVIMVLGCIAWGWKIYIHTHGIDGL